jgi:hypothetical protein
MKIDCSANEIMGWLVGAVWIAVMCSVLLSSGVIGADIVANAILLISLLVGYVFIGIVQWIAMKARSARWRLRMIAMTGLCAYLSITAMVVKGVGFVSVMRLETETKEMTALAVQEHVPKEYMAAWRAGLRCHARNDLVMAGLLTISTCCWYYYQFGKDEGDGNHFSPNARNR